jgi:hypothetical protein
MFFIFVSSQMKNKIKKIGVVCHDAGGAEIISSYISLNNISAKYCLSGPAIKVFERKFGTIKNNYLLADMISDVDWLLCGTSWQSNLEWNAIQQAKKQKKKVISFLEHWINYLERFKRMGTIALPDEIWVGDIYAQEIAEKCFPNIKIELKDNPYLLEVKQLFKKFKTKRGLREKSTALYVCENISDHMFLRYRDANYLGYTEHDSLRFFMENVSEVDKNIGTIVIRPHPSDSYPEEKYGWAMQHPIKAFCDIRFSTESSLLQDIVDCDFVVGAETMAMVVGLKGNKRVLSSIPKQGRRCVLPFSEIEHIVRLIDRKQTEDIDQINISQPNLF